MNMKSINPIWTGADPSLLVFLLLVFMCLCYDPKISDFYPFDILG